MLNQYRAAAVGLDQISAVVARFVNFLLPRIVRRKMILSVLLQAEAG